MFPKTRVWISALRVKTLTAILVPISFGAASSMEYAPLDRLTLYVIICFGVSIQVLTNLVNDRCDFLKGTDNETRKGPLRAMQSKVISLRAMNFAIGITTVLSLLSGLYLYHIGGALIAYLVFCSILLAFLYTAGPYALSYIGLGDIFVFIFFGPIASGVTAYLLSGSHHFEAYAVGTIPGFISTAILVANNVRDYSNDKASNKKTLIVRFGKFFGQIEYVSLLTAATIIHWYVFRSYNPYEHYIPPLVLLVSMCFIIGTKIITREEHIQKLLPVTSAILLIYGISTLIFWN